MMQNISNAADVSALFVITPPLLSAIAGLKLFRLLIAWMRETKTLVAQIKELRGRGKTSHIL